MNLKLVDSSGSELYSFLDISGIQLKLVLGIVLFIYLIVSYSVDLLALYTVLFSLSTVGSNH